MFKLALRNMQNQKVFSNLSKKLYTNSNYIRNAKLKMLENKNLIIPNRNLFIKGSPELCCDKEKDEKSKEQSADGLGRHHYDGDIERMINEQISHELNASFAYLTLSVYFGRTDIALPGCQGFFFNMHQEEYEHTMIFVNYQLMRGGCVSLKSLDVPEIDIDNIEKAFEISLEMEKFVKEKLEELYNCAEAKKDIQVIDLVTDFIEEQNRSICEMARLLEKTKITWGPLGEYMFDKMIFNTFVKGSKNELMHKRSLKGTETDNKYK